LDRLLAFKDRARAVLAQDFHEPPAALVTGILLGDDNGMSPNTKRCLQRHRHVSHFRHLGVECDYFNCQLITLFTT